MFFVEDTIENGVKKTHVSYNDEPLLVEDTIENGVKHNNKIIKETIDENHHRLREVVVTLKDGVKETKQEPSQRTWKVDNVIKETHEDAYHNKGRVQDVLKNGIKETQPHFLQITNPINFELTIIECKRMDEVNNVLEKGIKETRAMDEWVNTENIINKVINGGIKKTNWRKVDNHQTYVDHIVN